MAEDASRLFDLCTEEYVCLAFFLRFSPPAFLGALADFLDGVLAIVLRVRVPARGGGVSAKVDCRATSSGRTNLHIDSSIARR